jgi:hypothetical protein
MDRQQIEARVRELAASGGEWIYDVPLPGGVWTAGNGAVPHTRLKRIVQVIGDLVNKPLSQCRVLDLGSLEGLFPVEMAQQGAETVGVEIRQNNIEKARFLKEALGLENLQLRQDDVRTLSEADYGRFDAIICSGLLYHLEARDVIELIRTMYAMVDRVVVIDTHVALAPERDFEHEGTTYSGKLYGEFAAGATEEERAASRLSSADNNSSFWLTRPSLVNAMLEAGFSSVYECFAPAHMNYGAPGLESIDRVTFVGIRGEKIALNSSPAANGIDERWPEGTLSYAEPKASLKELGKRLIRRVAGR